MAKKKTQQKKVVELKSEKVIIESHKNKSIDWDGMSNEVVIVGLGGKHLIKGQDYTVTLEMAKILVTKGDAKLK